jgi:hypothetical protein
MGALENRDNPFLKRELRKFRRVFDKKQFLSNRGFCMQTLDEFPIHFGLRL